MVPANLQRFMLVLRYVWLYTWRSDVASNVATISFKPALSIHSRYDKKTVYVSAKGKLTHKKMCRRCRLSRSKILLQNDFLFASRQNIVESNSANICAHVKQHYKRRNAILHKSFEKVVSSKRETWSKSPRYAFFVRKAVIDHACRQSIP